ncbi:MAG: sarcosine oxidase [Yoonia sp.]
MTTFDVIVVGAGLMGSAAARHLAKDGATVALIGPAEPEQKHDHSGVFASHYDAARITRKLDSRPNWTRFSQAAIARYAEVAQHGEQPFFTPVGAIVAGPEHGAGSNFIQAVGRNAQADGVAHTALRGAELRQRFPYFSFPDGVLALHEADEAGWIDPRAHVRAEIGAAEKLGVTVYQTEVARLVEGADRVQAVCVDGQVINGAKAVVACGAFSMAKGLLPEPLPLTAYARTIAFFELDAAEAVRLSDMPSVVYLPPDLVTDPYILPPVRYPDGKTYLKIGGDPVDHELQTVDALKAWFRTDGDPEVGHFLERLLLTLMPDLSYRAMTTGSCVTCFTPHGNPLIYQQTNRLIALTAGNGAGAKCADELGRLGALVASGGTIPADVYVGSFRP